MHTSLDVVEERLAAASTKTGAVVAGAGDSRELYLGSLCTQVRRTTVGVIRNETLVFVNFSAKDASILKISVPIIKRRS